MGLSHLDKVFFGDAANAVKTDKHTSVYRMQDETGEGYMTCYPVFEGVHIIYNDFHMKSCYSKCLPQKDMIEINHCREGRIELEFEDGTYAYIETGDLAIALKDMFCTSSSMPLNHYHGISVVIDITKAAKSLSNAVEDISFDLIQLRDKLYAANKYYIMRANEAINNIFLQLYKIPEAIKEDYIKIKILELLLFLKSIDFSEVSKNRPYYLKCHVETVKDIMQFITQHIEKHITLADLSVRFHMPLTTMKTCFKGVYGTTIYAYMRTFRIQSAAYMLKETRYSIMEIAGKVGYDNASKFSSAFRDIMGVSPLEYRKSVV